MPGPKPLYKVPVQLNEEQLIRLLYLIDLARAPLNFPYDLEDLEEVLLSAQLRAHRKKRRAAKPSSRPAALP